MFCLIQNHQKPCFWYLKTWFFGGENLCFSIGLSGAPGKEGFLVSGLRSRRADPHRLLPGRHQLHAVHPALSAARSGWFFGAEKGNEAKRGEGSGLFLLYLRVLLNLCLFMFV